MKVNLMSSIPAVKTTTRPTSAGRNFVALSFLVNMIYFKDYHKILGTLGLDHVSFTQWIHLVEWIALFVKRHADWSVQKARTEAVRRGKQKKYAQKSGLRSTFSFRISLFFIISQNACLNFFETAFELLLYRKYGTSLSHSGKVHFSVSGHVTLGVVR